MFEVVFPAFGMAQASGRTVKYIRAHFQRFRHVKHREKRHQHQQPKPLWVCEIIWKPINHLLDLLVYLPQQIEEPFQKRLHFAERKVPLSQILPYRSHLTFFSNHRLNHDLADIV